MTIRADSPRRFRRLPRAARLPWAGAPWAGAPWAARLPWLLLAVLVLAQIGYPLTDGAERVRLTVATVLLGYLLSVGHALLTRGPRAALTLVLVTTGGGLAVEVLGVATGVPFGGYQYSGALGPKLAGVPLLIPLAWTWMAWPAWLAADRVVGVRTAAGPGRRAARTALAGIGLASWDVFLDPQMVAEGYWSWRDPTPALPGLPGIPVSNYLGWLLFAVLLMALLGPAVGRVDATAGPQARPHDDVAAADGPMYALYLWTYASSVLAHAVFLALPASAGWGALTMATVAVPLAVTEYRWRRGRATGSGPGSPTGGTQPAGIPDGGTRPPGTPDGVAG